MKFLWLLLALAACDDSPPLQPDLSAAVCRFPTGRVCGYDSLGGCPAEDSCNWCDCSAPDGVAACTLVACLDAGTTALRCQATSDCPSGQVCAFDFGCNGEAGRCTSARECATGGAASFCGCDGKTFNAAGPCADRPHSHRNGC